MTIFCERIFAWRWMGFLALDALNYPSQLFTFTFTLKKPCPVLIDVLFRILILFLTYPRQYMRDFLHRQMIF